MSLATATSWYWIHPSLAQSLAERVATDLVHVDGKPLALDGRSLVQAGAVRTVELLRGRLVVSTTIEALVAGNLRDAALALVAAGGATEAPSVLGLVGRGHPALVILMHRVFGHTPGLATVLPVGESIAALCDAARLWRHLLDNRDESARLLNACAERAKAPADLLDCAAAAASTGDNDAARRLYDRARTAASSVDDRLLLARAAVWLFGDAQAATRLFATLLAEQGSTDVLCKVAATARLILSDEAAERYLADAETAATTPRAWARCAEARHLVFGDDAGAKRNLDAALAAQGWSEVALVQARAFGDEAAARQTLAAAEIDGGSAALGACAAAWLALWKDADHARTTLKLAESRAKTSADWAACAAAYNELFADVAEVKRCLGELEKGAATTADWNTAARYWIDVLKDNGEAGRCVGRAEEVATMPSDFLACARNRHAIGGAAPDIARSLVAAEERSKDISELVSVAVEWWKLCGDEQRARATLTRAEGQIWSIEQAVTIARGYATAFNDAAAVRKALQLGEKKAHEAPHFGVLARAYKDLLGDDAEAQRWSIAEMEAEAGDDLVECARGWRRILGDGEAARQRLRDREATAEGEAAWERIANAWRDGFGDAEEAERALLWAGRWKMVDKAMAAGDWTAYAQSWKEILGEVEPAKARLRTAEERANTLAEWASFGVAWHRVFEDLDEAKRCIKTAEGKTRFKSDWKVVAEAWRQIGDYGEAQRCLDHR